MNLKIPGHWRLPDTVHRLPLIVTPRNNEPAESVVFRLTLANGYRRINDMLRRTPNFPLNLLRVELSRDKYIAIAGRLCGVAEEQLDLATPYRNVGGLTLFGHHFRKVRAVGKARVCPACLSEDMASYTGPESLRPYRRNWWEIQNIRACPIHAIALVNRCPGCDKPLQLIKSTTSCDCDPHIDIRRLKAPTIAPDDLVHDRWLLGRLGVCPLEESKFLDSLPIDVASRLCLIIGTLSESNFSFRGKHRISPPYAVAARSIGWSILHEWPSSFDYFLDKLLEYHSGINKAKLTPSARYGGLSSVLQNENSPELQPVFEAIRRHLARNQLIYPKTRIFGKKFDLGKHIALSEAAKMAGCGAARFLNISDALELPSAQQTKVGTHIVPTANVAIVRDFVASSIDTAELARKVGCDRAIIKKLVDSNMLRLKLAGNTLLKDLIDRIDAEKLISIVSDGYEYSTIPDSKYITAIQGCRISIFGATSVLTAIISKKLRGVGRVTGNPGFKGMIFHREDLLRAVNSISGTALSRNIIEEYRWKGSTLLHLKRTGHLNADLRSDYIYVQELNEFMAAHVSMNEMLDWPESPDTRGAIRQILRQYDVRPSIQTSAKVSGFWPRKAAREALGCVTINR